MPQVPYTGAPQGGPENVPLKPDVPGALLEGTRAIEGFGRDVTGAGDKLWNRAVQLKQDQNETEAIEGDSKYMIEAGKLRADFDTLQGEDRKNAYEGYQKNLVEARQRIRASLSNDDARRRYDFSSLRTQAYSITNGASAAATADKDWKKQTTTANVGITKQEYSDNPTPDNLAKIEAGARRQADLEHGGGTDSVVADNYARKDISDAILKRIAGVARNHADIAAKIMRSEEKRLTPEDRNSANNLVTAQATNQGAELIARDVQEWGKGTETQTGKTMAEKEEETIRRVKEMDPKGDLPDLERKALSAIKQKDMYDNFVTKRDTAQMTTDLVGLVQTTNASTPFELFQDPKAYDIYKRMDNRTRDATVDKVIKAYQDRLNRDDGGQNYKTLRGMAASNPELFLQTSPGDWKVGPGDWKNLMSIRDRIQKGAGQGEDPRVNKAMSWLTDKYGTSLDNMRVIGRDKDPKNIYLFKGALSIALDRWQEDHPGKTITGKDVTDPSGIWGQLRGEQRQERGMNVLDMFRIPWTDKVTPNWKMVLDKDPTLREQYKQQILKRRASTTYEPTEDELRLEYMRDVWKQFSPSFKKPE